MKLLKESFTMVVNHTRSKNHKFKSEKGQNSDNPWKTSNLTFVWPWRWHFLNVSVIVTSQNCLMKIPYPKLWNCLSIPQFVFLQLMNQQNPWNRRIDSRWNISKNVPLLHFGVLWENYWTDFLIPCIKLNYIEFYLFCTIILDCISTSFGDILRKLLSELHGPSCIL